MTYWHYDKRSIFALDKIYISRIYMSCCTKDLQIYDSKLNHLSSTVKLILLPIWVQFSSLVPSFTTLCSFTRGWLSNISCLSMWTALNVERPWSLESEQLPCAAPRGPFMPTTRPWRWHVVVFYIVTSYIKWAKTSLTYSTFFKMGQDFFDI